MKSKKYIPRTIFVDGNELKDEEVDFSVGVKIVLAEPGGGKTAFLNQVADWIGGASIRASIFRHESNTLRHSCLILDALDEVSRLDRSALDEIIVKARDLKPESLVLASRASEWDNAATKFVEDCFESRVEVLTLKPFSEEDQENLFIDLFPSEQFEPFRQEVKKFELLPLLSNPQFLILFANAFIEGDRSFRSKQAIFEDALKKLSSENNSKVLQSDRTPTKLILDCADELFAKLLLSGAVGTSRVEAKSDPNFPYLGSIYFGENTVRSDTIGSSLFKPGGAEDKLEPVHKIVAEYSAARYLIRRIVDPTDLLGLERSLAVIAPNSVVRDELRGLLGWMAALGPADLQSRLIEIDPYAVISNGDPAQLSSENKKLLLRTLLELSEVDPYFRRGDGWRSFSVAGFFDASVLEEVRHQLTTNNAEQLKELLVELLIGAPFAEQFSQELRKIVLDAKETLGLRRRAARCLKLDDLTEYRLLFDALMRIGDLHSLRIASFLVEHFKVTTFKKAQIKQLIASIATLYPKDRSKIEWEIGERRFVRRLVNSLRLVDCVWLLDEFTHSLHCTCGSKRTYQCVCRVGISKVMGLVLDRYCELQNGPLFPTQLWHWTRNLVFHNDYSSDSSASIERFQADAPLRRAVHKLAFSGELNVDEVWEMSLRFRFRDQFHAGWTFQSGDLEIILDWSFAHDLLDVWAAFHRFHYRYSDARSSDPVRRKMREHSREKTAFLAAWSLKERQAASSAANDDKAHQKHVNKMKRRRLSSEKKMIERFNAQKEQIRKGRHWGWLKYYANDLLFDREADTKNLGDADFRREALLNCIPFLASEIPTLKECAERKSGDVVRVLYAVCLMWLEKYGNLAELPSSVLVAVRSDIPAGYDAISDDLEDQLKRELNTRILATECERRGFLREYVGTQLSQGRSVNATWMLDQPEFRQFKEEFALDWLSAYPNVDEHTTRHLFEAVVSTSNRENVLRIIREKCALFFDDTSMNCDDDQLTEKRLFWSLRSFFFAEAPPQAYVDYLFAEKRHVFAFAEIAGSFRMDDHPDWPILAPEKILLVLDAFISDWPPVALPNSYGTGSPEEEQAYRFLSELVWLIGRSDARIALPVLDQLLLRPDLSMFHVQAKVLRAQAMKDVALMDFQAPSIDELVMMLDDNQVATVEDLRALLLIELREMQRWINGGATDPITMFHSKEGRVDENTATKRVAERLQERFRALGIGVTIEQRMPNEKRCDLTASIIAGGKNRTLVVEAKGQWHEELFDAPKTQLSDLYLIYPDAAHQGIFLAYWYGKAEKIAGRKNEEIATASELAEEIETHVPEDIASLIDVFVLDLSLPDGFNRSLLC